MASDDKILLSGTVTEAQPSSRFLVTLDNGMKVNCTISGKLRIHQIRITSGDKVDVEVSAYDLTRGRIIWRHK